MPQLPRWAGCAVGAVAVALATLVRFALSATLGENSPFLVYTVPVLAAAAVGGLRSGLITTVLALAVGAVAFIPRAEWVSTNELVRFGLFLMIGGAISLMAERMRALGMLTAEQRQALADAETYRGIVEEGAAYICRFRADGTLTFVNGAYCVCFGRSRAELLGSRFVPLVPAEDRPVIEKLLAALAGGSEVYTHEHRVILPDGRVRWHRWTNRRLRPDAGGAEFQALGVDVTDRREAEEARAASERRYRMLLEGVPQLVWTCLPDGRCDYLSRQWVEYTGVPEAEQLGDGWANAVHPDDRERLFAAWHTAVRTERPLDVEFRIRAAGGDYRWFQTRAVLFRHDDGTAKWFGTNTDIHDKRTAEERLRGANVRLEAMVAERTAALAETEHRFRAVFHSQFQFIGLMTTDGTLIEANRTALASAGVHEADVLGRPFWETVWWAHDADQRERLKAAVARAAGGTQDRFEAHHPTTDGGHIWVDFSLTPFRDEAGRVVLLIPEGRDVTDRKRAEAALHAAEERFRLAVGATGVGVWEWHLSTGRVRWNELMFRMYAVAPTPDGMVTYRTWSGAVLPEDLPAQEEALRDTVRRVGRGARAFRIRLPDGSVRDIEAAETVLTDARGAAEWVVGTNLDVTDRNRAAADLRASEERFRAFMDNLPLAAWATDDRDRLVIANRFLARMLNREPDELIGLTRYELMDAPSAAAHEENDRRVRATGTALELEEDYRRPDGETGYSLSVKFPVRGADGATLVGGVALDITDRKRSEEQLRARDELLHQFIKHSPAAIAMFDTELRYLQHSDRWLTDYGLADRDIIGRSHYEVFPDVPEQWRGIHRRVLAGAVERCDEDPFHRADGTTLWLQWECRPWYRPGGAVGGLIMLTQVITARKRAEAALRESEELYRSVVESLAEGVVVQDAAGAIVTCNEQACAALGLTRDQMTGRTSGDPRWRAVRADGTPLPGDEHPNVLVLRTGAPVFGAVMGVHQPEGELRWLLVNAVPVRRTGDGPGPATVASFHDITEARALDEKVRASLREKELLLKEIHHRVKNNLQIVSTLLDLQSGFTEDRGALAMFAESRGRVKSMALVHERLYKSHDVARVDFAEYARQLAADLFRAYRASDEDVRLEVAVTAPPLPLDVAIPCGLLLNELMSNCFKHAFADGRAGTLRVALAAAADARELVVADDGPGLPPGFDFRNSTSFGLQLVCTLVEQLGGTIEVRGPGTAFVVRFRTPMA